MLLMESPKIAAKINSNVLCCFLDIMKIGINAHSFSPFLLIKKKKDKAIFSTMHQCKHKHQNYLPQCDCYYAFESPYPGSLQSRSKG